MSHNGRVKVKVFFSSKYEWGKKWASERERAQEKWNTVNGGFADLFSPVGWVLLSLPVTYDVWKLYQEKMLSSSWKIFSL